MAGATLAYRAKVTQDSEPPGMRQSRSRAVSACHERPPRQSRSRAVPSLRHTAVPPASQSRSRLPASPASQSRSRAVSSQPRAPSLHHTAVPPYARSAPPAGIARPVCSTTKWKSLLLSVVTACIAPRHLKRKPKAEPKHQRCFWEKRKEREIERERESERKR